MISRKLVIAFSVIVLVALGLTSTISSVIAAKPHFSGTPNIAKNSDLSITANFKAAALGKKATNASLSSLSIAELACVNPGGKSPPSKKVDFEQMQNQVMEFKPKDGKIKGSVTLGPPKSPSVLDICPNRNWSIDILSLTYGNVALDLERKNSDVLKFNFGNVTQ